MKKVLHIRWQLIIYDFILLFMVSFSLLVLSGGAVSNVAFIELFAVNAFYIFILRLLCKVYSQVWRYGGIGCYIHLIVADSIAFPFIVLAERLLPIEHISFSRALSVWSLNLLASLVVKMFYRYAFKCSNDNTLFGKMLLLCLRVFAGPKISRRRDKKVLKRYIAIIGAGEIGIGLADQLINNSNSTYYPVCFVDVNKNKIGREIQGIPVIPNDKNVIDYFIKHNVKEAVFAIRNISKEEKKNMYEKYRSFGFKTKIYDYPIMQTVGSKMSLREFEVEDLLFRKPIVVENEKTAVYYKDKVILVTGGGGSIGSEICRQLAKMSPKKIVILDIYENGAYDVEQELRIAYNGKIDIQIEICSITDIKALQRVFETYRPQIVINAAAHKHVPLMEHNCVEAVRNNVFGTKNVLDLCERYNTERFMMVSTDKAVNPTNVMGATKRMCEMLVQNASTHGKVICSSTRFGNVLGSAGSVIPLFKRQIAQGGPITLTDKRIIRYFMTIPEASQLVLTSGAMAKNGELFVLDMGQPVKILDLAQNMIDLSGVQNIKIVETGLRPGEKLYEELLINNEELCKTDNSMIFIEKDESLDDFEMEKRMNVLRTACETENDNAVRDALHKVVSTYKNPEDVNRFADLSKEMKITRELETVK